MKFHKGTFFLDDINLIQLLAMITSPLSSKRILTMNLVFRLLCFFPCVLIYLLVISAHAKETKPERIVVLTFDDSVAS
ncbi:uncharacterized protein METZ01_LOCUS383051, partial [marine metagenome]